MKVSLLESADYADHRLISETNLRNPRFLIKSQRIKKTFSHDSTDKICVICGNLTQGGVKKKMWVHGS